MKQLYFVCQAMDTDTDTDMHTHTHGHIYTLCFVICYTQSLQGIYWSIRNDFTGQFIHSFSSNNSLCYRLLFATIKYKCCLGAYVHNYTPKIPKIQSEQNVRISFK